MKAFYAIAAASLIALSGCAKKEKAINAGGDADKTYAAVMSENFAAGSYTVDMIVSGGDNGTDMPCKMAAEGGSEFVSMTTGGMYTEFYTIDGQTYMLFPDINCYRLTDGTGMFDGGFFGLDEGDTLTSTETADGLVTEVYTSGSGAKETVTFVFDEDDGLLKSFRIESGGESTDITVNSISFSGIDIILPDLTGWTDISDSASIDEETSIKFMLYSMGITEEMAEAAGFSYDELARLSGEELNEALSKMGVDVYG